MKKFILPMVLLLATACARTSDKISHTGEDRLSMTVTALDSVRVNAMNSSLSGNFFVNDTLVYFLDQRYCKLMAFTIDGDSAGSYLGYGQGPNELPGVIYGYPVKGADNKLAIVDNSLGWYEYDLTTDSLKRCGRLDFKWNDAKDYDDSGYYIPMEMTDFAMTFLSAGDGKVMIPLNVNSHTAGKIDSDRYTKGKLFGTVDLVDMTVSDLKGSYPQSFLDRPTPGLEFFDFAANSADSTIYVSFAADPLIYAYNYDGEPKYSFGRDAKGIDRDYTVGYESPYEAAGKDMEKGVGLNTGLTYIADDNILFRTIIPSFPGDKTILQGYRDNNLVLEATMPQLFKLLGKIGDTYVGVKFIAIDADENNSVFTLYTFKLAEAE